MELNSIYVKNYKNGIGYGCVFCSIAAANNGVFFLIHQFHCSYFISKSTILISPLPAAEK